MRRSEIMSKLRAKSHVAIQKICIAPALPSSRASKTKKLVHPSSLARHNCFQRPSSTTRPGKKLSSRPLSHIIHPRSDIELLHIDAARISHQRLGFSEAAINSFLPPPLLLQWRSYAPRENQDREGGRIIAATISRGAQGRSCRVSPFPIR